MSQPDQSALLAQMEALVPMLAEHAAEAEQLRKPVDSVWQAILDTGAMRYFVPRSYGGYEFDLQTFMKIGMALGGGCVSTAWVTTFCMEHNWLMALYSREAQDDIFGRQPYIVAPGTLAPNGRATPVDGGYRVTGRWEWGTGVMHADWALVGALMPVEGSDGMDLGMFVVPMSDVTVHDTWQVAGMAATGSNDIEVKDVFVPAHLVQSATGMRQGNAEGADLHDSYLYRMPMLPVLGLTAAAPALGAAKKAVELSTERMKERLMYGTTSKQGEKPVAQHRLAHAALKVHNLEILIMALAKEVEDWGKSGQICPDHDKAFLRLRIGNLVRESRDVVRELMDASGAHAHFLSSPLQRFQRDLNTLSCHTVFDTDVSGEAVGRSLLGLEINIPL